MMLRYFVFAAFDVDAAATLLALAAAISTRCCYVRYLPRQDAHIRFFVSMLMLLILC